MTTTRYFVGLATLFFAVSLVGARIATAMAEAFVFPAYETESWRPKDYSRARPLPLPRRRGGAQNDVGRELGIEARARGAAGLFFSSTRVFPPEATALHPYSAVVKLFFRRGATDGFFCSGSVVSARLVLTAGHCVFTPGFGEHSDFRIVPAYDRGNAPFGIWRALAAFVSPTWVEGAGVIPNPRDWALLVVADQVDGTRIGEVTGWLGWQSGRLTANHVHIIGYSENLDSAERMHAVASGDRVSPGINNVEYGSDMLGGSSGSPWIQNFGESADGQGRGSKLKEPNRVVGVTSYGGGRKPQFNGGPELDEDFEELFDQACAHSPRTCERKGRAQPPME